MMNNPDMMSNIMNMMGGSGLPDMSQTTNESSSDEDTFENEQNYQDKVGDLNLQELNDLENVDIGQPERANLFVKDDTVIIVNLKNKLYNNKTGSVIKYEKITNRYIVYLDELDKHLSIKEINLKPIIDVSEDECFEPTCDDHLIESDETVPPCDPSADAPSCSIDNSSCCASSESC